MVSVQIDESEKRRLDSLSRLAILDTPRERRFDLMVFITAAVFRVPIAAISIVAETRQWLKAQVGEIQTEIPREISFCHHVIADAAALVINDATVDPRFHSNPLVTGDSNVRFYAGVPIKGLDDQLVGALCIIDVVPRGLDPLQLLTLTQLGEDVSKLLQVYPPQLTATARPPSQGCSRSWA